MPNEDYSEKKEFLPEDLTPEEIERALEMARYNEVAYFLREATPSAEIADRRTGAIRQLSAGKLESAFLPPSLPLMPAAPPQASANVTATYAPAVDAAKPAILSPVDNPTIATMGKIGMRTEALKTRVAEQDAIPGEGEEIKVNKGLDPKRTRTIERP